MPESGRRTLIENAPTFLDEARDPGQLEFCLDSIRSFAAPVLLTLGETSPPAFAPVVARLAEALPRAEVRTIRGAGHIPHITSADAYCQLIRDFIGRAMGTGVSAGSHSEVH
jgi:pimeloyl-ACP methyl ester carboxylesterase